MEKHTAVIVGSSGKPMLADVSFKRGEKRPLVIYAHGFNGFKDWGNFDLIVDQFVRAGFAFLKFNFSHNGTTPDHPQDFAELEAFGNNNYTRQLFDLGAVLDWLGDSASPFVDSVASERAGLIGHSMGGGIAVIKTAEDPRVKALVTWAAISQCKTPWGSWPSERISAWQASGVEYYVNGRTKQQMPLYYQLYRDYQDNTQRLDIIAAAGRVRVPWQLCHGMEDTSVPVESALELHDANPQAQLMLTPGDHVFDRRHPWEKSYLPDAMQQVVDKNIVFFKEALVVPIL